MTRNCVGCGTVFLVRPDELAANPRKWCTKECWYAVTAAPRCTVTFTTCRICGTPFCAKTRRTTVCYGNECQRLKNNERMKLYFRSIGGNPYAKHVDPRHCPRCGKRQKRSPGTCRECHQAIRSRRRKAISRRRKAILKLARAARGSSGRIWTVGPCAACGQIIFKATSHPARFCGPRCKRRANTSKFVTHATRREIYMRDDEICQLCFDPVDMSLRAPDIWCATLDHVIPQSKGGDHSPENLRLAHLWCNSVRGDETYYTADVLSV